MKLITVARKGINRLKSNLILRFSTRELDPLFYITHYEDLRGFDSERLLREHYWRHGRHEGRFPNRAALLWGQDANDEPLAFGFKRIGNRIPRKRTWRSAVAVSQLLAWCGDRLDRLPSTRKEAIDLFRRRGVYELWPIKFDYLFDPAFYVATYKVPGRYRESASGAYRHFLTIGFPRGFAPNEATYLYPYLGGQPYPEDFNWRAYASRATPITGGDRIRSLSHLFRSQYRDFSPYVKYLGRDAARVLNSIGRYALVRRQYKTAVAAFGGAMDVQASADSACLLGDSLRGLGRTGEALKAYERSIALGAAPIWSYFHAIDIFCEQNDYDAAFEVLRHAFRPWRNKVEFRHKLRRCVELFFQYRSRQAHELYRRGSSNDTGSPERASADSLLRETLDRIKGLYLELDDLPAPLANQPDGYVTILANDGLRQCTHYRIEQKVEQFEAAGIPVRVFSHDDVEGFIDSLVGARAAIFYRVAAFPKVIRAILHANSMGLTTYYEIDDLIFDPGCYPDPFDSFEGQVDSDEYAGLQFGVPLFRYALSMCNASIASTEALSSKMRSLTATPLSIVLPNALDSRTEQWIRIGAERSIDENRRIRVFYGSGTRAHNADFNELVGPALLDVMRRFPQVDLVIVGHLTLRPDLAAMADRLHVYPFTPDIDAYWSILASCDVNLAVLHPGEVADCKSEIKWLEAAIFQIPSIVSETATYRKVVANGVDGYIASNGEDWINHLSKLVVDGAARRRMGANARSKALREYSPEAGAKILERAFGESGKKAREPGDRKRLRVLICNVFFHPQSHGGATRVVEDNIRSFQRLNDDLELGVFCSDEGVAPSGQLRMGAFADIPVYRLSTPIEPGMDWRPFNTENAASFGRVLDHFRPDIVHFHCIQRLTASIVEETLQREIPYLVTFHDGWWISDNQFLVDEDGFLRLPTSDIINDCRNRPSPLESIERRQRLQSLLRNAKVLLAVSAQFAEVYGNAGIERVHSVENGLPEHQVATRKRRPDGRLALGHIGGRSAHKGAFLIEATLRQEHYDNLHVTMVDGTLPAGERVETTWGTTPVTLTGPYPQSEVGQLYGHLDVLLAPSTWPESYGLVTREALWHGLWVVASNLGAIADGIQPGRNGFVIDTSTTADLKKILHELDKQPDYYSNSPDASTRTLRSSSEQARELHQIYWEIARATGRPRDCEHRSRAA